MLLENWHPVGRRLNRLARPFHPNDAAQARVFAEVMRAEIAELEELIAMAQVRWANRLDAGRGSSRTPEPVLRLREKRNEVQRLLDGLQVRFAAV
ncbi:hypothetical protein [Candidatus Mycolicibacterium alkanivorans]|uniref:Uncharacterized protein n=1 Tax=Candidatus Mycolicibacterium alkanivorans TaxID=2954114 RepID=A0ABS9YVA9_9MYCO|nr:hypothetical protein [Candidatus Mycolicibacterium alkanivorans]MCI4675163.1 hypothetical protein [Candidatus Mycolicibacterium alkanivorans]